MLTGLRELMGVAAEARTVPEPGAGLLLSA
jgi:hypothetical protein